MAGSSLSRTADTLRLIDLFVYSNFDPRLALLQKSLLILLPLSICHFDPIFWCLIETVIPRGLEWLRQTLVRKLELRVCVKISNELRPPSDWDTQANKARHNAQTSLSLTVLFGAYSFAGSLSGLTALFGRCCFTGYRLWLDRFPGTLSRQFDVAHLLPSRPIMKPLAR
jgi:hypothetical protein